ncbi:MAG: xanthine dehydrogenase family protein molybdopterin-binding subunit [Rhodospirillaceae bacterium]|jgi:carbon-monoxide dehydrogenase large subunit
MGQFGIGQPVRRQEDIRFVTGQGCFTDDFNIDGQAYVQFLRSPHAHAEIVSINTSSAETAPGVIAVFTGKEAEADDFPVLRCNAKIPCKDGWEMFSPPRPALCTDRVRFVGDLMAMVIAETAEQAKDAAEQIEIDYNELPCHTDTATAALPDTPQLWPGCKENTVSYWENKDPAPVDDVFSKAFKVAKVDVISPRVMGSPMEPRVAVADYDAEKNLTTIYNPSQGVHRQWNLFPKYLPKLEQENIRVVSLDVGGGFGLRIKTYPESTLLIWAAARLKRALKWCGDRYETLVSDNHARDHVTHGELALDEDGKIMAARIHVTASIGAYPLEKGPAVPTFSSGRVTGQAYIIPELHHTVRCVFTNNSPTEAYRGAGRPEAAYIMERLMEEAAIVMNLEPAEIRRRNFITPQMLPYINTQGFEIDSGHFEETMDIAMKHADWNGFKARQKESEARGKMRGIGIGYFIEASGGTTPYEEARVRFNDNGTVTLFAGTFSHGQGHATVFPQIVADKLGIDYNTIDYVDDGDTHGEVTFGGGTGGSRSSMMGGTATARSCDAVIVKGKKIAAHNLQTTPEKIEFNNGVFKAVDSGGTMTILEAAAAARDPEKRPDDVESGFDERYRYDRNNDETTGRTRITKETHNHPNGCHIAEVEIDPDTGVITVVNYTAADDNGIVLNPMILHGQIHGGVVQGLGQALLERTTYDAETGQFLTGSFLDYAMPRAKHVPNITTVNNENAPCLVNELGVKGAGEGGCCGAPPAIVNAVLNALKPLGITHIDMPLHSEKIWRLIHEAKRAGASAA